MTRQSSFKRLVRTRMQKTGESYTAARASLLAAREPQDVQAPALATSDESIRERTGRGWEAWFDLLDEWGGQQRSHREIARWVADQLGIAPLVWEAQAVTTSYERARGLRAVGERADGFVVTVQKTVPATQRQLFDAFVDTSVRDRWLPDNPLRDRTTTPPKSARFDWHEGDTRVHVMFERRADRKAAVIVEHARLADADHVERMRAYWRERLSALGTLVEGGGTNA